MQGKNPRNPIMYQAVMKLSERVAAANQRYHSFSIL